MNTFHIHIKGRVQGVGFRPYVYKLAKEFSINGWVNNSLDGVHIEFNATQVKAEKFCQALIKNAPALSLITHHHLSETESKDYKDFVIKHSNDQGEANVLLSPDFAICPQCIEDINTSDNKRFGYPFTTCTKCGPRYSIAKKLPYDRVATTMDEFVMCPACQQEYDDPEDRRYYSQTNSCPDCPVTLELFTAKKQKIPLDQKELLDKVAELWEAGKIIAIKGIGGYLLTCDATNQKTVELLRERKHRPSKPFALMFPNLDAIKNIAILRDSEIEALESPAAPIVLLQIKKDSKTNLALDTIAPGLDHIGGMLPYAPLYQLLMQVFGKAIIATSGNFSNSPIVYQDVKALEDLSGIADYVLTNNREILIAQDDSVVKFSPAYNQKIILRRSRGYAPSYIHEKLSFPKEVVLATGADLKSTLTISHQQNCYTSQYIGDLESYDAHLSYQQILEHLLQVFKAQPELVLADKHPNYFSSRLAEEYAAEHQIPIHKYQHHMAHFGAVLAENNLIDNVDKILGIVWDGTGNGGQREAWGGEFFSYEKRQFSRLAHFDYFPLFLGDKMAREPRCSALALCNSIPEAKSILETKFTPSEWKTYQVLLKNPLVTNTSSVGRIFDAVASLLGLIDEASFEGEAAMLLEKLAWEYVHENGVDIQCSYLSDFDNPWLIPTTQIMKGIVNDIIQGVDKSKIAAQFHYTLVDCIRQTAQGFNIQKVAFSGGVFQNSLLIDLIRHFLNNELKLYFHLELSPNDENISFGQLICYQIEKNI